MTKVILYSVQPVLVAGLQSVLAPLNSLMLSGVCPTIGHLMDRVQSERPDLLLIELTQDVNLEVLNALRSTTPNAPVILWADLISTEFASQAIGLGIRGILRKNLPVELLVKCLLKVAAGEFWVEKSLSDKLLCTKQVVLTARERQIASLLTQGLKNKEVAYSLGITEGTVKVYLSRLFQKVGVKDRFELALFAMEHLSVHQGGTSGSITAIRNEQSSTMVGRPSLLPGSVSVKRAPLLALLQGRAVEKPYSIVSDPAKRAS
jgi:two-component system nitrate/nitrite response regulator NarL